MAELKTFRYFAGGAWHEPIEGAWFDSDNPTTGRPWARIPRCTAADVGRAVSAAHQAFADGPWSRETAAGRGRLLRRLGDTLARHADMLGRIETTDNGKRTRDITPGLSSWLADSFHYYGGLADKIEGRVIPVDAPHVLNYTVPEPYGPVACITAWNSPLLIAIWKIAPALAAGNTVVLKPSEHASASALALMEAFVEADLPPGVLNVVTGYGAEAGHALVTHPAIRLISFTGGVAGGAAVAAAAAPWVKPLILELGGKSPQVVFADADAEHAAFGVAAGIFPPAGQSCIAGSRLIVHRTLADEMIERLRAIVQGVRLGDPTLPETHIGPIANRPHFDRVLADIARAESDGARLVCGGAAIRPDTAPDGWFIAPTIFTDVTPDMAVAQEEVFGPVLAVLPFDTEEEALALANGTDYGLAAGIWTADTARAVGLAARIQAGTVYINTYFNATTQSPVGGFKRSGYGRENGIEGMQAFQQTKSVWLATAPTHSHPFP